MILYNIMKHNFNESTSTYELSKNKTIAKSILCFIIVSSTLMLLSTVLSEFLNFVGIILGVVAAVYFIFYVEKTKNISNSVIIGLLLAISYSFIAIINVANIYVDFFAINAVATLLIPYLIFIFMLAIGNKSKKFITNLIILNTISSILYITTILICNSFNLISGNEMLIYITSSLVVILLLCWQLSRQIDVVSTIFANKKYDEKSIIISLVFALTWSIVQYSLVIGMGAMEALDAS